MRLSTKINGHQQSRTEPLSGLKKRVSVKAGTCEVDTKLTHIEFVLEGKVLLALQLKKKYQISVI